jgi:hypothetical protein
MKPFAAAAVCIAALYLADMFFFDGVYYRAVAMVISHVLNGY